MLAGMDIGPGAEKRLDFAVHGWLDATTSHLQEHIDWNTRMLAEEDQHSVDLIATLDRAEALAAMAGSRRVNHHVLVLQHMLNSLFENQNLRRQSIALCLKQLSELSEIGD